MIPFILVTLNMILKAFMGRRINIPSSLGMGIGLMVVALVGSTIFTTIGDSLYESNTTTNTFLDDIFISQPKQPKIKPQEVETIYTAPAYEPLEMPEYTENSFIENITNNTDIYSLDFGDSLTFDELGDI